MAQRQPLVYFAVAIALGILIDSLVGPPAWLWLLLFPLFAIATVHGPQRARVIAAVALCLPLAGIRHAYQQQLFESASVLQAAPSERSPCVVDATVDQTPVLRRHPLADELSRRDLSPWLTECEVSLNRLRDGGSFRAIDGRALVVVDARRDELRPGDRLLIYGQLSRFERPSNPGQRDLRDVYRRRLLHVRIDVDRGEQIQLLSSQGWDAGRWVASIARSARRLLLKFTGESSGPLAVALVIGQRDFVDAQTRDQLLVTGTAHLLSVSGLHLAIIVVLAKWLGALCRMPRVIEFCWILAVTLFYAALTGGRPPVLRAALLVFVLLFAFLLRRPVQTLNALALAAIVLMLVNPLFLFSVGVQLSFLAVATLLMCGGRGGASQLAVEQAQKLEQLVEASYGRWQRGWRLSSRVVGRMLWYSGCVTVIATPLVWYQFHVVSPISVITNVILGPLIFVALGFGVATVIVGWVAEPLAQVPGALCDGVLKLISVIIDASAAVPYGHFWLPSPPGWWVLAFYAGLLISLLRPRWSADGIDGALGRLDRRKRRSTFRLPAVTLARLRVVWIACWISIALWFATSPPRLDEGQLEATFVDVGHGTSVVIRAATAECWMYDCGRLGNASGSSRDIDGALWSLRTTQLRGLFLSHADADHFNAVPGILRRFKVARIYTSPGLLSEPEAALVKLRDAISRYQVPVQEVWAGDRIETAAGSIQVLHPPHHRLNGSDNAHSLVLRIDCGETSLVLPGDIESPGTELLIRQPRPQPGGVIMAPHHGSLTTDAEAILSWSRPHETIVSGGRRARRPAVTKMLAATGSRVHVTAEDGAVRVRIDRTGEIELRSWHRDSW